MPTSWDVAVEIISDDAANKGTLDLGIGLCDKLLHGHPEPQRFICVALLEELPEVLQVGRVVQHLHKVPAGEETPGDVTSMLPPTWKIACFSNQRHPKSWKHVGQWCQGVMKQMGQERTWFQPEEEAFSKEIRWEQTGIWVLYKVSKPLFEGWWTGSSMFIV